jgi:hypothetical protein
MTGLEAKHRYGPSKASLVLSGTRLPYYFRTTPGSIESALPLFVLSPMAVSRSYVLLQKGEDPFHTHFKDLDGLTAFTM